MVVREDDFEVLLQSSEQGSLIPTAGTRTDAPSQSISLLGK
jgi:hypothetical protein